MLLINRERWTRLMLLMNRDKERQRDEKIASWRFCRGGENIERQKDEEICVVKWGDGNQI